MPEEKRLVWLDMEMTGLDPESDRILEVAAVLTEPDLTVIDDFQRVAKTPRHVLARMNKWCQETHGRNGLAAEAARADLKLNSVEHLLIAWLMEVHGVQPRTIVLAGNTIHFDRRFIARWMPDLHEFLHYRLLDVTSVREFVTRVLPAEHPIRKRAAELANPDRDVDTHRAMDDCYGAIEEAKLYLGFLAGVAKGFEVGVGG